MEDKKLKAEIEDAARRALKNREELLLSTLRLLLAAIHNREIEQRVKTGADDLNDEEVIAVIRSEAKKRKDAIIEFTRGGRPESARKEAAELAILEKHLPQELTDEEIEKLLQQIVAGASIKDFGRIMGAVMKAVEGRASGDRVSAIAKRMLAKELT